MRGVNWENVLILQTSFLGDMVLTLPLIAEVKRRFPVRRLSLLCQPLSRDLLQDHPAIDEILVDDKKKSDGGLAGLRRQAAAIAAKGFTLALTPHKSLRSALLLYWAGIPARVGFCQSRGWFLFHQRVERDGARHDVERNLSLLKVFGVTPEQCRRDIDLPVSAALRESVQQKFRALGLVDSKIIVGVSPGSVWATKRWTSDGFGRLIQMLQRKLDCQVVLFGGADDSLVVKNVLDRCGGSAISLVGHIGLRELPAAIGQCRVFVTNDSGPMHIAVAQRVPTAAIFCATTPALGFYPYTENAVVVEKDLSCRPCTLHGGRRCPLASEACMRLIDPQTVLAAVEHLLRREPKFEDSSGSFQPTYIAA